MSQVRRRQFLAAAGTLFVLPSGMAQLPAKTARIGYLNAENVSTYRRHFDALRMELRALGYVEGKNLSFEARWAEGRYDRLPELAAELVRLKVDVLVIHGTKATMVGKRAATTIPIVMAVSGDAVAYGLVASLARPGGNITGSTQFTSEVNEKRLQLLKEVRPRIVRVAFLLNFDNASSGPELQAIKVAAEALKLGVEAFEVHGAEGFTKTFATIAQKRVDAILIQADTMFTANTQKIADFAASNKIPSSGSNYLADAGGLIGYSSDLMEQYRRAAVYVDKILRGAKPADLPVEQPTKFELVINLKAAKALEIKIPESVLVRADRVIE